MARQASMSTATRRTTLRSSVRCSIAFLCFSRTCFDPKRMSIAKSKEKSRETLKSLTKIAENVSMKPTQ